MREHSVTGIVLAAFCAGMVIMAAMMMGPDDCPRGSVAASGIARCR